MNIKMSDKNIKKKTAAEKFFENIVEMNPKIDNNIFSQTEFNNKEVEQLFKNYQIKSSLIQNTLGDIMLLLGYIANLIYIFTAYYRNFIFIYCLIIMLVTFVLIVISYKVSSKNIKRVLSHLQVFLISFFMNSKVFFIIYFYNTPENDNGEEILRVIIYDYISTNLFVLVKLDGGFHVNLFYFLVNMCSTIVANYHSLINHYFYLEVMTSFFLTIIFYSFRKIWAFKIRYVFAEKYKYKNLYSYTYDFLNGFNGFQINFKNKSYVDCNKKFSNFLTQFIESNKESMCYTEDSKFEKTNLISETYLNFNSNHQNLNLLNTKNMESETKEKPWNSKTKKNNFFDKKEKESIEIFLDSLIEIDHSNNEERGDILNRETEISDHSLNSLLKRLFNDEKNYNKNLYLGIFELNNIKMRNIECSDDLNNENNTSSLTNNKKDKVSSNRIANNNYKEYNLEFKKSNTYFDVFFRKIRFYGDIVIYNIILYDVSELIITKKIYEEEIKTKQKIFSKIESEFYHPLNKIISSVFDVTDIISCFDPTPKTSSISLSTQMVNKDPVHLNSINDSNNNFNNNNNNNNKIIQQKIEIINHIEKIHNLSQYLIFLVNNILFITKGGNEYLMNSKIEKERISIKALLEHCFEIMKILLSFNQDKSRKIKPLISFENRETEIKEKLDFENLEINTDSLRLKQLLLNFICNSVRFTKSGNIGIICNLAEETVDGILRNCLIITIKDSGVGINSMDKKRLLLFLNTNDNFNYDSHFFNTPKKHINRGIGFFIIKNIANRLNYKIKFKSELGKGSEFYVIVPLEYNYLNKISKNLSENKPGINNGNSSEKQKDEDFNIHKELKSAETDRSNYNYEILESKNAKTLILENQKDNNINASGINKGINNHSISNEEDSDSTVKNTNTQRLENNSCLNKLDTIEEQYDLESNGTTFNQKINQTNITNKLNMSLFRKKNYIIIVKSKSKHSSRSNKSLVGEEKENTAEKKINSFLSKKDLLGKYLMETKKDDPEEFISYLEDILGNSNVKLILFEDFKPDKHEKLIKMIKNKDNGIKILIQVDDEDKLENDSKYYDKIGIDGTLIHHLDKNKSEEILSRMEII